MHRLRFVAAVLFAPAALAGQASKSTSSPASLSALDARSAHYAGVAKQIWGFAELGYQEYKSSALLRRELATAGFKVDSGVAGMPTAWPISARGHSLARSAGRATARCPTRRGDFWPADWRSSPRARG